MSKIVRKAPFSAFEKAYLRELVAEYVHIIESKKTDSDFNKKKNVAWAELTSRFNSSPQCQEASVQQLKKLWLNMKARARDAKTLEKQRTHTGGGPFIPDMKETDESVLSILPHIMPTIKISKDSDGAADADGDDDDIYWQPKRARINLPSDIENIETYTTAVPDLSPDLVVHNEPTTPVIEISTPSHIIPPLTDHTTPTTHTITSTTSNIPLSAHTTLPSSVHLSTQQAKDLECVSTTLSLSAKDRNTNTVHSKRNKTYKTHQTNIDSLKIQLIQNDIEHRKLKFQEEFNHLKRMNTLQYKILLLEYESKKKEIAKIDEN